MRAGNASTVTKATATRARGAAGRLAAVALLLGAPIAAPEVAMSRPAAGQLLRVVSVRRAAARRAGPGQVARTRPAMLARLARGDLVPVEPEAGRVLRVRLDGVRAGESGLVAFGHVEGEPASSVNLVALRRGLAGTIVVPGSVFRVLPLGAHRSRVERVDPAARLPDRVLTPTPGLAVGAGWRQPNGRGSRGNKKTAVDLLVLFTPRAASQAFGGTPGLKDEIALAVADTNTALQNSGVRIRIRLIKTKRVSYDAGGDLQSNASDALSALTDPADGVLDKAHRVRRRFGADIVSMVIQRNLDLCGLAWLSGNRAGVQPSDAARAFNVVPGRCLRFQSLAHELGHNMGAQHAHDDPVSNSRGGYDFSFGHKAEGILRTVMAYSCANPCTPLLAFSTPRFDREGTAYGIADADDNARSFNADRKRIAAFLPCRKRCGR